jgi:PiT family inorganic phosphate transporter
LNLKTITDVKKAKKFDLKSLMRIVTGIIFILIVMVYVSTYSSNFANSYLLVIAAIFGGYMAMNIGANDVANNVGPAVGSKAITIMGAIIIAAIFESAGALIAGGDVVGTIKKGIIDPTFIKSLLKTSRSAF